MYTSLSYARLVYKIKGHFHLEYYTNAVSKLVQLRQCYCVIW